MLSRWKRSKSLQLRNPYRLSLNQDKFQIVEKNKRFFHTIRYQKHSSSLLIVFALLFCNELSPTIFSNFPSTFLDWVAYCQRDLEQCKMKLKFIVQLALKVLFSSFFCILVLHRISSALHQKKTEKKVDEIVLWAFHLVTKTCLNIMHTVFAHFRCNPSEYMQ